MWLSFREKCKKMKKKILVHTSIRWTKKIFKNLFSEKLVSHKYVKSNVIYFQKEGICKQKQKPYIIFSLI